MKKLSNSPVAKNLVQKSKNDVRERGDGELNFLPRDSEAQSDPGNQLLDMKSSSYKNSEDASLDNWLEELLKTKKELAVMEEEKRSTDIKSSLLAIENAKLKKSLDERFEEIVSLTRLLDESLKKLDQIELLISAKEDQIANHLAENKKLVEEISFLRESLEEMHNSTSWRLTRPLRGLKKLLNFIFK